MVPAFARDSKARNGAIKPARRGAVWSLRPLKAFTGVRGTFRVMLRMHKHILRAFLKVHSIVEVAHH
jgi:hypothetical protein